MMFRHHQTTPMMFRHHLNQLYHHQIFLRHRKELKMIGNVQQQMRGLLMQPECLEVLLDSPSTLLKVMP
mgnify:CR=1 FL=1